MASKLIFVCLCLAVMVAFVSARPRFLAIPLEDVQFIREPSPYYHQAAPHHRIVRRQAGLEPDVAADSSYGRGGGGNDYVDYGAYTGGYGAFGWYTDHPVGNVYGSSY